MNFLRSRKARLLDVTGLFLAGFNNTILALLVAVFIHGPGTAASQPDLMARAAWITEYAGLWKAGWIFWFAPTLTFSWSYYALGRNLDAGRQWRNLAIAVAVMAAAVDVVGMLLNFTILPELAAELQRTVASPDPTLQVVFRSVEMMGTNLMNIGGYGLYTLAGLLILPAAFMSRGFPKLLLWIGIAEWGISAIATAVLVIAPDYAQIPLVISFLLYAPWVWGGAIWLLARKDQAV